MKLQLNEVCIEEQLATSIDRVTPKQYLCSAVCLSACVRERLVLIVKRIPISEFDLERSFIKCQNKNRTFTQSRNFSRT